MATMKTLNGYGFNATELNGKTSDSYLQLGDDGTGSTGEAPKINAGTFGGMTVSQFVDMIYPVGSIYMSVSNTSPASLFGGTWEQLKDRFLLGAGDSYDAGSIGGEATHALTINEIAKHYHDSYVLYDQNGYGFNSAPYEFYLKAVKGDGWGTTGSTANELTNKNTRRIRNTSETGKNAAHNNMPPYLAVYMWKRTA